MTSLALKIPPVVQFLVSGAAMSGLAKTCPSLQISSPRSKWPAGAVAATGLGIAVMGVTAFNKAQTTVNPHKPENASRLVTQGIYQYTRNPMYLGLALVLLAWAIYLAHLLAFVVIFIFGLYITRFQIMPEERVMAQKFGTAYQEYKQKVRRWF